MKSTFNFSLKSYLGKMTQVIFFLLFLKALTVNGQTNLLSDNAFDNPANQGGYFPSSGQWLPSHLGQAGAVCDGVLNHVRSAPFSLHMYTGANASDWFSRPYHVTVNTIPGQFCKAGGYIFTPSGYNWVSGSIAYVKIVFKNNANQVVGQAQSSSYTIPLSGWTLFEVEASTPSNATKVVFSINLEKPLITGQSIINVDDCYLYLFQQPTVNVGNDASICISDNYYQLTATAANYSTLLWTTSGDGTFSTTNILNPVYSPGSNDQENGVVELCLTAQPIPPVLNPVIDCMNLAIIKLPAASAGSDATICQNQIHQLSGTATNYATVLWTTSGDGTFNETNILNPVYTPGTNDVNNASVTLTLTAEAITPCATLATDTIVLTIQKLPVANAGDDATICQTEETHQLAGSALDYDTIFWTTSGDGTFSNSTNLNPVYYPGQYDITNGTALITLSALPISPCIFSAVDNMNLAIQKLPTADAGDDTTICNGENFNVEGTASFYSSVLWSTSGDGTFGDPVNLTTIYYPGTNDTITGSVNLSLTAYAITPCSFNATSICTITLLPIPVVTFAPVDNFCHNSPPYELTEGNPAGGVYTGPSVTNGWFYPEEAGVGTHLLTYVYTDEFGCTNSANQVVVVEDCTGVEELTGTLVTVAPNPGDGNFVLHVRGNAGQVFVMKIFSSIGTLIFSSAVSLNNECIAHIDLTTLPDGLYFLTLNGQRRLSTKLIIQ